MSDSKKRKASSIELPAAKEQKGSLKEKEEKTEQIETEEEYSFELLPPILKKRVAALEKIQEELNKIEKEYLAEHSKLLTKYETIKEPLFKKRSEIIAGAYEPKKGDLPVSFKEPEEKKERNEEIKGIPNFWLQVLDSSAALEHVNEKDRTAFKYLVDIRVLHQNDENFVMEFYFAENPFFEDKVLKRTFKFVTDEYTEKTLLESKCSKINWKPNQGPKEKKEKKEDEGDDEGEDDEDDDWRFFQLFQNDYLKKEEKNKDQDQENERVDMETFQLEALAEQERGLSVLIKNPIAWFKKPKEIYGLDAFCPEDDDEDEEKDGEEEDENQDEDEPEEQEEQDQRNKKSNSTKKKR